MALAEGAFGEVGGDGRPFAKSLGRDPVSVWAESWNPPWSGFQGDIIGTARFRFEGGASVLDHASKISRGEPTSWYGDIVAEGEHATLLVSSNVAPLRCSG